MLILDVRRILISSRLIVLAHLYSIRDKATCILQYGDRGLVDTREHRRKLC